VRQRRPANPTPLPNKLTMREINAEIALLTLTATDSTGRVYKASRQKHGGMHTEKEKIPVALRAPLLSNWLIRNVNHCQPA
jgi:hypothetical protein